MIGKITMDPIDNVSRDSEDGTYRCPQCQTPFTRRSNLRRHFQIHLRGSLKCEICNEEHSTQDSLQDHLATSHCTPAQWSVPHEKLQSVSPPNYGPGPFSSQNTSMGHYSDLASPAPGRAFQVPNFGRLSLSTSGASGASNAAAAIPRSTSSLASDRRMAMPPGPDLYSHRSNSSSSSIGSPPMVPSLPYTRVGQGQYGLYSPSEAPPLSTHQEWVEDIMGQQGFDNGERPIYTRRQVKNMLDAISDCFIESVESVLNNNANGQRPLMPNRSNNYSRPLDTGVRQMILNEAIPRLVSRVQGTEHNGTRFG